MLMYYLIIWGNPGGLLTTRYVHVCGVENKSLSERADPNDCQKLFILSGEANFTSNKICDSLSTVGGSEKSIRQPQVAK